MSPPTQVTACDADTRAAVESAGGRVTRVYYTAEGLGAVLHVSAALATRCVTGRCGLGDLADAVYPGIAAWHDLQLAKQPSRRSSSSQLLYPQL